MNAQTVAFVHRGHVFTDLLNTFMSCEMEVHVLLKITVIAPNGVVEAAEDGGGVS